MGTFSGTFSENAKGVPLEPLDFIGGRRWFRTTDPLLVRQVFSLWAIRLDKAKSPAALDAESLVYLP